MMLFVSLLSGFRSLIGVVMHLSFLRKQSEGNALGGVLALASVRSAIGVPSVVGLDGKRGSTSLDGVVLARSMHFRIVGIFQGLYKSFPIVVVFCNNQTKIWEDCLVKALVLDVCRRIICRAPEVFHPKKRI